MNLFQWLYSSLWWAEVPLASSINVSLTTVLVVSIVVVVPFMSSVIVASVATSKSVLFNNCNLSDLSLATIVCEPAFILANSRRPCSVPAEASSILPVIFA